MRQAEPQIPAHTASMITSGGNRKPTTPTGLIAALNDGGASPQDPRRRRVIRQRTSADWSALYYAADPLRLLWSAALPLQDVALAIEEARRSAAAGVVGLVLRPNPVQERSLHHADYAPLWAEIERFDRPVSLHNAELPRLPSFDDRMDSDATAHVISHPFEAMAAIVDLVCWGVFERFP